MKQHKKIRILAALLLLAGCARTDAPAPVFHYGASGGAQSSGMHTAVTGDTPWTIAQDYHVSLQDIITVNSLQPPYNIHPGQRIKLPPPSTYTARPGDTLYSISQTFSVGMSQLAQLNNLSPPYAVSPGQQINMPAVRPAPPMPAYTPAYNPRPYNVPVYNPPPVNRYAAAPPVNNYQPNNYQPAYQPAQPIPLYNPTRTQIYKPDTQSDIDRDLQNEPAHPAAFTPSLTAPEQAPVTQAYSGGNGQFAWPVNGEIISRFGAKPGGLHNDGINIRAGQGAPVRAADAGTVVYAGDDLKGFGNLVLVRHQDKWMTAYAHMNNILVKKGMSVSRGQALGAVGKSGGLSEPQLHFEVRHGTEALDPQLFLGRAGL